MLKQVSVYAENKKGALKIVTGILTEAQINILGSVTNDSAEYGIIRMVVTNPEKAQEILEAAGCTRNSDGFYERDGEEIGFVISVMSGEQDRIDIAQAAAQQAALAQAQAASIPAGSGNVIFVGDSRTGQMANAVGGTAAWPGTAFVACFGGGVDWLSTAQAKKDVDQYVTPGSVIILNYGVNDLSRHNDYITTINRYAQDWISKGATVYFASVGPVGENEYGKRNWAVEYFNNQLNNRLDARIGRLNLYVFLTGSGYTTQADGLHYDGATYAAMFRFLMQSIGRI